MYAQPQPQPPHPLPLRARPRGGTAKKTRTPWVIIAGFGAAGFIIVLGMIGLVGVTLLTPGRLPAGIRVAGVLVGDKTAAEATRALQQSLANETITLTDSDRSWVVPLSQLGIQVDVAASVQAAQSGPVGASLQPRYDVDLSQTQNALISLSDQINIPATADQAGRAVDIPFVLNRLHNDVTGELADGVLDLNMIEVPPPLQEQASANGASSYTGPTTTHVVERGQELGLIAKLYNVSMDDIVNLNGISNPDLLYVGEQLTIPAAGVYQPTAADSPPAPLSSGNSIVVSTENQRIYAYENGQLIRSDLVSTGLPGSPTVHGDFNIYVKYLADDMSGPDYFLPQVPYVMYFYQGYGIHGTYWHNAFGRPMSHGCVNLPTDEAQWFFNWAEVGTLVRVI